MEGSAKGAKPKPATRRPAVGKSARKRGTGRTEPQVEQRLAEALEQQAATSEILRVISQSQTDVQPVFETIAAAALKLCSATSGNVLTFDGVLAET